MQAAADHKASSALSSSGPRLARVVVEIGLNREFDYLVPPEMAGGLRRGSRVVVPFGRSEAVATVVGFPSRPAVPKLKTIRRMVGDQPMIDEQLLDLARWMGTYYLAPFETAVRALLPGAVRKQEAGFRMRARVWPQAAAGEVPAVEALRRRAPRQAAVLDVLNSVGPMFLHQLVRDAGAGRAAIQALEKKGFVRVSRETEGRSPVQERTLLPSQPHALMPEQQQALERIVQALDSGMPAVVLLFGVTGSGKTEVYLQSMQTALDRGQGAILLVPEIALTPQAIERFHSRFGDRVAVLHSRLSEGERHDEWHRLHTGQAVIAVGARSAVFAPVRNLGLIVVDEEHETSYKQEEAPRYHARDVAVMRGHLQRCTVVLGSATPALESFQNARRGKYALARLTHRVDHRRMPSVRVIDMRVETEKAGRVHVLSEDLVAAIRMRLDRAEQTILFLNRRGFSTSLVCVRCGQVAQCAHCSLAMTYHRPVERLRCHLCGADRAVPSRCPNPECRDPGFRYAGFGTQKVETLVAKIFPHARLCRMDADTTRGKTSHQRILGEFRTGKIDILLGTQMIAKGLDFPNVTLVGVIFADLSLHLPDFRAGERTFQLLTQVAGRAGRGDIAGEVLVQTYTPFHPAIQSARRLDFEGFAAEELEFRREFGYPPFTHLVCVTVRGRDESATEAAAAAFAQRLRAGLPAEVQMDGSHPAPLARAKGVYRFQVILRAPATKAIHAALRDALREQPWPKGIGCAVDVDAQSLL